MEVLNRNCHCPKVLCHYVFIYLVFREGLTKRQVVGQRDPTTKNSLDLCSYYALCYEDLKCVVIFV